MRRPSPILLRYFAGSFLLPLVCSLLGFASLFLLNDVFGNIHDFLDKRVSFQVMAMYFLARQPQNLVAVAPISVLLAASFMTLMMGRHNELTALRAAGLSLFSCAFPVWALAVLCCGVVFAVNEAAGPACAQYVMRIEQEHLGKKRQDGALTFRYLQGNRDWFIQEYSRKEPLRGVVVRQFRADSSTRWVLSAQSAEYSRKDGWLFRHVTFVPLSEDGQRMDGNPRHFTELAKGREEFSETPDDFGVSQINWEQRSIRELCRALQGKVVVSGQLVKQIRCFLWHRLTFPLGSLVAALFGVALTIANDRMGLMRGFASVIFLLVCFYLVGQLGLNFGIHGWLPPFVGGALSNLVFLAVAFGVMWKRQ
ncbi:MAG: LptF/LptG family permease [Victivallales bacterium]|nr:LptF/LptG family permease [Victivallales bacterium]